MTLPSNHVISDTGHTSDHNAIATQINANTAALANQVSTAGAAVGAIPVGTGPGTYAWEPASVGPYVATPSFDTEAGSAGGSGQWADGGHSHPRSGLYDAFGVDAVNVVAASGSTQTIPATSVYQTSLVTMNANCTFLFPTPSVGARFTLVLTQDTTGSRAPTLPANIAWVGGTLPTWSTAAGHRDMLHFICVDGLNWIGRSWVGIVDPPPPLTILQTVDTSAPFGGSITFASNLSANSAVLAVFAAASTSTPSGGGLTWTRLDDGTQTTINSSSSSEIPQVWLGTGTIGGAGTATINFDVAVPIGTLFEISNALLDGVAVKGSGSASSSAPFTTPDMVAPRAGDIPITIVAFNHPYSVMPGSPWTIVPTHDNNGGAGFPAGGPTYTLAVAHQSSTVNAAHYTTTWTPTFGTSFPWSSLSFFLKHF